MGKQSQKDFVKNELKLHGFITRNKCLRNYISRLSAIIFVLRDERNITKNLTLKKIKNELCN